MQDDHLFAVFAHFAMDPPRPATHVAVLLEVLLGRAAIVDIDLGRFAAVRAAKTHKHSFLNMRLPLASK